MPEEKMPEKESLIPKHGGYRKLKSFQVAQLVYDVTVRFCDRYISKRSRTHDQMVQAARSGVQNIAEGSQAAGTSKKTELKLTNVARSTAFAAMPAETLNNQVKSAERPSMSSAKSTTSTWAHSSHVDHI
jgi:four helix bundle protein